MLLARLDRRGGRVTVRVTDTQTNLPVAITSINLAVLATGSGPDASTTWQTFAYTPGLPVIISGPDADPTSAVPCPEGGGVFWGQVAINGNPVAFPIEEVHLQ